MIFENLDTLPASYGACRKQPCKHRRHRSNMMLNPLNLKHLNRLDTLDADVVTLNLEDAIAPSRKKEALHNIALFLSHLEKSRSRIVVRVNPIDEGGAEEIAFLNDFGFDAIRVAKVRHRDEIEKALSLLSEEKELHISLETAEAFRDLAYWGDIDSRFTVANLGILDLLTSLNLPQSLLHPDNPTIRYILSKFLVDARTAGLFAFGFMFQDYRDTETYTKWCRFLKRMGFEGTACMGPKQVQIANEVFATDRKAVERAAHIKKRFEEESARGNHGFMDEKYGFIDEPIYKDALLTLQHSAI